MLELPLLVSSVQTAQTNLRQFLSRHRAARFKVPRHFFASDLAGMCSEQEEVADFEKYSYVRAAPE
jgi:hypothetical protein